MQCCGLIIWLSALLPVVLGKPFLCFALILYLVICAAEVYTLKFFIIPRELLNKTREAIPYSPYLDFIVPTEEELDERVETYSKPIDMDNKVNKITYQKSRSIIIIQLILIQCMTG